MASALPTLLDHLVDLMEGTASGVGRSIDAGVFRHYQFDPLAALPATVDAPYPFEIESPLGPSIEQALDNAAGSHRHDESQHVIHVAYAISPHDQYDRQQVILDHRHAIRRCIEDPPSWDAVVAYFEGCRIDDMRIATESAVDDAGTVESMYVLQVTITLSYYEDHS